MNGVGNNLGQPEQPNDHLLPSGLLSNRHVPTSGTAKKVNKRKQILLSSAECLSPDVRHAMSY